MAADWVDASTDEHWGGGVWPMNYLGGGVWEELGGPYAILEEQATSPFVVEETRMFGVRFFVSIDYTDNPWWVGQENPVAITTSENRSFDDVREYGESGVNTQFYQFEFEPISMDERVVSIQVYGFFGGYYGDDALVYGIQVKIEGGETPYFWQDYRGTNELCL